ncbi:MAG: DNA polymerase IV [Alphaproteobacteria bacterium]
MARRRRRLAGRLTNFPTLCRDCVKAQPSPAPKRCVGCGSPRLMSHPELESLSVAHVDCDAFYASIEKRDDPSLIDRPVIIGGRHRGVVATACYIARIKGVHSAMPMFKALKACPDAVVISPDMAKYVAVGHQIRNLMQATTPLVEPISIDEAFLDLTGTQKLHNGSPAHTLLLLVRRIEQDIGITVSVGLSHNKFLAKLASDQNKPRGFTVIGRAETADFLDALPIRKMWGVGQVLHRRLKADGIATIGQLRHLPEATLVKRYGSIGRRLYYFSRGQDDRRVKPLPGAKNVSTETTFNEDVADLTELQRRLWRLCESLAKRLKAKDLAGRTVTLKLKTSAFRAISRSHSLPHPTQLADTLYREGCQLLRGPVDGTRFRLLGIGVSHLHPAVDADPLDLADPQAAHRKKVEAAIDAVRDRLGTDAIGKGRGLP